MRSDLTAAIRSLTGAKTFTAAAVTVLALGIGATTAIYSVIDGVVLRPLPFPESDQLVAVREHRPSADPQNVYSIGPQNFLDWDAEPGIFEALAAVASSVSVVTSPDAEPQDVRTVRSTADLFDVLRVAPALGRVYRVDEETAGRHRVAVLTDGFSRRRFGAASSAVGQTLTLDDEPFEIIGVLPPEMAYSPGIGAATDVFLPLVVPEAERIRTPGVSALYLTVVGRLRRDVSLGDARSRMDAVAARLRAVHPAWNGQSHVRVMPLSEDVVGADWQSWLWMLFAGAASVLLIACVNVAVLQLSRASAREHEMGVRAALGGSRWRLIRQLLVENVLLAVCGAGLALVVAGWGVHVLRASLHDSLPRVTVVALDYRVLAMMAALALTCGVASGLAPAWHLSSPRVASDPREGTRLLAGRASRRIGRGLVVTQVAVALVLLVAASLWTRSVLAVSAIDPGFSTERLLTAAISPQRGPTTRGVSITVSRARTPLPVVDHVPAYIALVDRLRQSPGILHAAFVSGGMPLGGAIYRTGIAIAGRTTSAEESAILRFVTEGYFQTLGIQLLAGRAFVPSDRTRATPAVVVNAAFAKTYFDGIDAVGRAVSISERDHEVVGGWPMCAGHGWRRRLNPR